MNEIQICSDDRNIKISFDNPNPKFKEYLKLGLGFDQISDGLFKKEYSSNWLLVDDLTQLYKDVGDFDLKMKLDDQSASIIEEIKKGSADLKNSLELGLKIKTANDIKLELPGNFYRHLKDFQIRSVAHISSLAHSANFSVPGSGKTTIGLAAYSILKEKGVLDALLVVGPLSSFAAWEEEFTECFKKHPISGRISGSNKTRQLIYSRPEDFDIFLISYHMLKFEEKNLELLLRKRKFLLILDESHHIKSFHGGIHAEVINRLSIHAKKRLILSGTPVPNKLEDLWSQFTFLYPNKELLWSKRIYEENAEKNPELIKERINPLFIRITKDQLKIPPPKINRIKIKLDEAHYKFYYELARSIVSIAKSKYGSDRKEFYRVCIAWVLQSIDDPNILALNPKIKDLLSKNKELNNALVEFQETSNAKKIYYLENYLKRLIGEGKKVLVWTSFVNNIIVLSQENFKALGPLPIYGDIPKDDSVDEEINREKFIRLFKNDENKKLLFANPAACAESISLHKVCKNALYLDRTFNCAQYLQSVDRIHRLGITESPSINLFIGQNTLDEIVDSRLEEKKDTMLRLLNDPFQPINLETSENDLFGIISEQMKNESEKDVKLFEDELERIVKQ